MTKRPDRVVVVGRDAALWLSAAVLDHALAPAGVSVIAVELPTSLDDSLAYASLPPLEALHARLGLDEAALLRTTQGSFSLGCNIVGAADGAPPFFLAHGAYGAPIDGAGFFAYWLKARRFGLAAALEDFSLTAMAARQGRMLVPDAATEAFGRTDYGYHLPAIRYVAALKARALRQGVTLHQTRDVDVERDPASGAIRTVLIDAGGRVDGDLFIDASGAQGLLIARALGAATDDWRGFFPFDRRLRARGRRFPSVPAYTELRIGPECWTALHASQAATHIVHAFACADCEDDAALVQATAAAGGALANPVITTVSAGRRDAWTSNCVAIGAAACAFDPLFDVELHAIQLGLVHLLALFPAGVAFAVERDEYNRVMRSLFERVRDFQAALYQRGSAPAPNVPDTLAHRITTFQARGDIAPMEHDSFAPDQWQALLTGLGLIPDGWPPAIDRTPPDRIKDEFRRILGFIKTKVLEQPTHARYLDMLCGREAA
jgi:tryptophan halogenase